MQSISTKKMILCALFTALTAILSQATIPIGVVPINLATFAVFCAGCILGARLAAVSMAAWLALGAVGVPVYTMFGAGLGRLFGPTGGFIFGYVAAAFVIGKLSEKPDTSSMRCALAMAIGSAIYFTMGTLWYMNFSGVGLGQALLVCVLPFIPGDLLKIAAATVLVRKVRPLLADRK